MRSIWRSAATWGITVLPRCQCLDGHHFAPDGKDIRFGLNAIQNVGANVVDAIVETRHESKFTTFKTVDKGFLGSLQ